MTRLERMDEAAYQAWREGRQRDYAEEKVCAGNWPAGEAEALSRQAFDQLLPNGLGTAGHEIRAMVSDGEPVGHAWFTIEDREAGRVVFIYDIAVGPAHRRRGYARLALVEIEAYAREHGCAGVQLHVFGDNTAARALYRSQGFVETNVMMLKRVDR